KWEVEVRRFGLGLAPPGQEFVPFGRRVQEELAALPAAVAPTVRSCSPVAPGSPMADPFVASVRAAAPPRPSRSPFLELLSRPLSPQPKKEVPVVHGSPVQMRLPFLPARSRSSAAPV
ncbi:hypothetical protein KEM55_000753, partial [Ascosphaera atra]